MAIVTVEPIPNSVSWPKKDMFAVTCEHCGFLNSYKLKMAEKQAAAHAARHDPVPEYAHVYEQYPSLSWGVEEWVTALTVRGDIMDSLADHFMGIRSQPKSKRGAA